MLPAEGDAARGGGEGAGAGAGPSSRRAAGPVAVPVPGGCVQAASYRSRVVAFNPRGELFEASLAPAGDAWRVAPVALPIPNMAVTLVTAGEGHCLALSEAGEVWAWGDNDCGQVKGRVLKSVSEPVLVWGPGMMSAIDLADPGAAGPAAGGAPRPGRSATQPGGALLAGAGAAAGAGRGSFRLGPGASAMSPLAGGGGAAGAAGAAGGGGPTYSRLASCSSATRTSDDGAPEAAGPSMARLHTVGHAAATPGVGPGLPRGAGPNKGRVAPVSRFASVRVADGDAPGALPVRAAGAPGPVSRPGAAGAGAGAGAAPSGHGWHHHAGTSIAAGARHSCIVTRAGDVLLWGWNLHGQCARDPLGRDGQALHQPARAAGFAKLGAHKVAAGTGHTAVLTRAGEVWAVGWNDHGQLGSGDTRSTFEPELVDHEDLEGERIVHVACGARHTAVLSDEGSLFTFGWNKYGQCGLETSAEMESVLEPVAVDVRQLCRAARERAGEVFLLDEEGEGGGDLAVRSVSCGRWHTVVEVEPREG